MAALYTIDIMLYNEVMKTMTQRGKMKARISCTLKVRDLLSNIAQGGDVNYDELLRYLLHNAGIDMSLSDVEARIKGAQMTDELSKFKPDDESEVNE